MDTTKLQAFGKNVVTKLQKDSPTILTGSSLIGLAMTVAAMYKASPIIHDILEEKREKMEELDRKKKLDKLAKRTIAGETVKELAPVIAPTAVLGSVTAGCIVGSHSIHTKRMAVLSAAYSLSEKSLTSLNSKMNEMLGEKKAKTIHDAVVKDRLDEKKAPADEELIVKGSGDVLCYDVYSGRHFASSAEKIGRAINEVSSMVRAEMYVTLNDFYDAIGSKSLPPIPMGNDVGWIVDDEDHGVLPIHFSAILTEDNRPCLCVEYEPRPVGVWAPDQYH